MTWSEWSEWFIRLFGLSEKQAPTVAAWVREAFVPGGIEPDELRQAAVDVMRGGPPRFLNEIPAALFDALRQRRASDLMAHETQQREGGADVSVPGCRLCEGTGWVTVPQAPQPEGAGEKGYLQTCCVTCRCVAGLRLSGVARDHRDQPAMTLEQYEARHGAGWAEEVLWWRRKAAADGRIKGSTKGWDEAVERITKRKNASNLRA